MSTCPPHHALMKRAGSPSPRFKKAWSPASRDPRFSRGTTDGLLARINPGQSAPWTPALGSSWPAYVIGTKARKMEVYNPRRKGLLLKLMAMADAVDPRLAPSPLKVSLVSIAPMKAGMSPRTAAARSQVRAELGGEAAAIDWNVLGQ